MKTNIIDNTILFSAALLLTALLFTSCNKSQVISPAKNIAGEYSGNTIVSFKYSTTPYSYTDDKLLITDNADGTVNADFTNSIWGQFSVKEMEVKSDGDKYFFDGSGQVSMGMSEESKKSYDFTLNCTYDRVAKKVSAEFNIPVVMGGVSISFTSNAAQ